MRRSPFHSRKPIRKPSPDARGRWSFRASSAVVSPTERVAIRSGQPTVPRFTPSSVPEGPLRGALIAADQPIEIQMPGQVVALVLEASRQIAGAFYGERVVLDVYTGDTRPIRAPGGKALPRNRKTPFDVVRVRHRLRYGRCLEHRVHHVSPVTDTSVSQVVDEHCTRVAHLVCRQTGAVRGGVGLEKILDERRQFCTELVHWLGRQRQSRITDNEDWSNRHASTLVSRHRPCRAGPGGYCRQMAHSRRAPAARPADKVCASCGRKIEWRKKWEKNWDEIEYCSDACRRHKVNATDRQLEDKIRTLLDSRSRDATICPSDVARAVSDDAWRELMEPVRRAARRLVDAGEVEITQKGTVVDPSTAKGPIRIRWKR